MGLHAEFLADWNIDTRTFGFERDYYVGLELLILAGIGAITLPVTVGVSARLNMDDIGSFDIYTDLRPYFVFKLGNAIFGGEMKNTVQHRIKKY